MDSKLPGEQHGGQQHEKRVKFKRFSQNLSPKVSEKNLKNSQNSLAEKLNPEIKTIFSLT